MTLGTILTEFILMDVGMTTGATPELNTREYLEFFSILFCDRMTFDAYDFFMLS